MAIIEQIKAEIERLYNGEAPKHDQQCNFDDGYFTGIDTIAQFIDTLELEKPMDQEGLEEELDRYLRGEFQQTAGGNFNNYIQVARHFYELGVNARKV